MDLVRIIGIYIHTWRWCRPRSTTRRARTIYMLCWMITVVGWIDLSVGCDCNMGFVYIIICIRLLVYCQSTTLRALGKVGMTTMIATQSIRSNIRLARREHAYIWKVHSGTRCVMHTERIKIRMYVVVRRTSTDWDIGPLVPLARCTGGGTFNIFDLNEYYCNFVIGWNTANSCCGECYNGALTLSSCWWRAEIFCTAGQIMRTVNSFRPTYHGRSGSNIIYFLGEGYMCDRCPSQEHWKDRGMKYCEVDERFVDPVPHS